MKYGVYSGIEANEDFSVFEFTSTGPRGPIRKQVVFLPFGDPLFVNLAFGDIVAEGQPPDDKAVSGNGDRNKVLATVAEIVGMYTTAFPERWVFFRGSTEARTRLYRIAIDLNYHDLSVQFEILGAFTGADNQVEPFQKGRPYDAFLVKRKNH